MCSTSYAQNSEVDSLLDLSLEELMQVEFGTGSRLVSSTERTPAIITSFSKEDIDKMGVTSFIDILKHVPSVEASIGPNGSYRVSFRGKRQEGIILCLLNGQAINNPYDGALYSDIPYEQIQKIEIIRSAGSAIYGNNAAIGVINIITNRTNNDVSFKAGTNGTYGANTNLHFETFDTDIYFNVGYYNTGSTTESINQDNSTLQPWSLTYLNKDYEIDRTATNYYFNSGIKGNNIEANFNGFSNQNNSYTGHNFIAAPKSKYANNQILGNVKYTYEVNNKIKITPKIYANWLNQNNIIQETPINFTSTTNNLFANGKQQKTDYNVMGYGGELTSQFELSKKVNLIVGNVFERQTISSFVINRNYLTATTPQSATELQLFKNNRTRSIFAYFFETDINLNKFSFLVGGRLDSYSDFGQNINPRFSVIYTPNKNNYLKGIYGTAFRAPTFRELYDQSNLGDLGTKGNPNLRPQNFSSLEFEYGFTKNKYQISASVFSNNVNNLIAPFDTIGNAGVATYENLGITESFGVDIGFKIPVTEKLNLGGNFSLVETFFFWGNSLESNFFNYINTDGRRELTNIPTTRLNLMADFTHKKWTTFISLNHGSSAANNLTTPLEATIPEVKIPAYTLLNFSVGYKVNNKLTAKIAANNIGPNKYSDPDQSFNIGAFGTQGLIQPGATYTVNLKYTFKENLRKKEGDLPHKF